MEENTVLDELKFIRKIIEDTKRNVVFNGKAYILWGILVIIGMLSMYFFYIDKIQFNYIWIWIVLISVGLPYSFYVRRKIKLSHSSTFAGNLISYVWNAAGASMFILGILGTSSGVINSYAIIPIFCIIIGSAYFISGKVIKIKWLSNLSFGWWIGGVVLFYITSIVSFLIMALLMLFLQTIPGIIIYRKYKQEVKLENE